MTLWMKITRSLAIPVVALTLLSVANHAQAQQAPTKLRTKRDKAYETLAGEVAHLERQGAILRKVAKLVRPNVVHIEAQKARLGISGRPIQEAGSGVLISFKGKTYVLTNRHVIDNTPLESIKIKLADGRQLTPTREWNDPGTDVGVMAVSAEGLIPARLGNSDQVEIGDFVLAIGSPFGLSHSVTYGIISAKGRHDLQLGNTGVQFQDFMQTDAAINPGNSGGPLISLHGEVIGINTAIASNSGTYEGVGFSIPINLAKNVARQLIETGQVSRAFLGVTLDASFTTADAAKLGIGQPFGAHVTGVQPDTPAEKAKLQVDDIILQYNGVRIEDDSHLVNLVGLSKVGSKGSLLVFRGGKKVVVQVQVGDRNKLTKPRG